MTERGASPFGHQLTWINMTTSTSSTTFVSSTAAPQPVDTVGRVQPESTPRARHHADRCNAMGVPDPQNAAQHLDPLQCDLGPAQSPRMQPDEIANLTKFVRNKANTSVPGTLSLRSTLDQQQRGGPDFLTRLGLIDWQELIGVNTRVVLPLFPDNGDNTMAPEGSRNRNRNGREAAAVINLIHRAAPHVTSVDISAGHGPGAVDKLQRIDLSKLVPPVPEITIRIKELGTTKVEIFAPENVIIKVVRDDNRQHMNEAFRNAAAPIKDIKLHRTTGQQCSPEDFQFEVRTGTYSVQRANAQTQYAPVNPDVPTQYVTEGASPQSASEQVLAPLYRQVHLPEGKYDDNV